MGIDNFLRYGSIGNLDIPWGWKDPRNTFTLPFWLKLFPKAKVIHIRRHGVDVANSLLVRRDKKFKEQAKDYYDHKLKYFFQSHRRRFVHSSKCYSLQECFDLWEKYMSEGSKHARQMGKKALELRYEDLLDKPDEVLKSVRSFCNLYDVNRKIGSLASSIDKSRAYAYRKESHLCEFALRVEERLKAFGYEALP